jgi:WD40 repeat protein
VKLGPLQSYSVPIDARNIEEIRRFLRQAATILKSCGVNADRFRAIGLIAYTSNRSNRGDLDIFEQQTTGGATVRLTNDVADERQPDLSPDGSLIAFRSERSPAGVYIASALGGQARLLAPDGRAPRFSPDAARWHTRSRLWAGKDR